MRKRVYGRSLSRTKNQRTALFRGLLTSLFESGGIETTLAKAKAIKPTAEKLITKAVRGTLADRRQIHKSLPKNALVDRLVNAIAPTFQDKKGGYLKIVRLGARLGDGAMKVKLMFSRDLPIVEQIKPEKPAQIVKPVKPEKLKSVKSAKSVVSAFSASPTKSAFSAKLK